jgi:hypothetical protein
MHHLLAFEASQAGTTTYAQLLAIADQLYTRQNNQFQIPTDCWCRWAAAMGTGLTAVRMFTASLRLRGNPQIFPFALAAWNSQYPQYLDFEDQPLKLVAEENLEVDASHVGAGPDLNRAFVSISQTMPNENMNYKGGRWVRGTATCVNVVEGWGALGQITFDDVLEGGSYACYGMIGFEASTLASRLVFQAQYERPGSLSLAALGNTPQYAVSMTNMGLWGVFDTYSTPQLECYSSAAGSVTETVWMYVAKADGFQPPFRGQQGY